MKKKQKIKKRSSAHTRADTAPATFSGLRAFLILIESKKIIPTVFGEDPNYCKETFLHKTIKIQVCYVKSPELIAAAFFGCKHSDFTYICFSMSTLEKIFNQVSTSITLFVSTSVSLLKVIAKSSFALKLPRASKKSCIILGNGPSLRESLDQHLELIKKFDIVCVNNFAYSEYFEILKPSYYVLLDPYYSAYNDKTIESREAINISIRKFKTINWPIVFLLPVEAKKSFIVTTILNTNKNIKVYFFNYVVIEGFTRFKNFIFKKNLGMPQCQNVLGASLFLSVNIGYKEIYLLGADSSWHEDFSIQKNNKILLEDSHFYDKSKGKQNSGSKQLEHRSNVAGFFLSLYKAFRSYDVIKEYADYKNTKIYNASAKSYIDSYEKKELREQF